MLISSPALVFTAVATRVKTLPSLLGKRPVFLSKTLQELLALKERATTDVDLDL
jgi:hypothetical protein